jgi:hypothetical protein
LFQDLVIVRAKREILSFVIPANAGISFWYFPLIESTAKIKKNQTLSSKYGSALRCSRHILTIIGPWAVMIFLGLGKEQ